MAAGILDIVLVGVVILAGVYLLRSGALNQITNPTPITTAPITVPTGDGTTTTPTGDGTTTTPTTGGTTTTPTTPVDPLQALLDQLLGQGGSNTLPTTGGTPTQPTLPQQPVFQGNPQECSSRYNGKCDTECKSGNTSLCQACMMACGGATIGAVQTLPPQGGVNQQLCSSKYNGKCNTECSSGNTSECSACKAACGSFGAHAYYVQTPMSLMTSTVFRNNNYSTARGAWSVGVSNWK